MAYDEELAGRIRLLIGDDPGLTERKMFGGLAFSIHGNMAITVSRQGGIMVRVDPAETEELIASTPATMMVMRGRLMTGWLRVGPEDLRSDGDLEPWVDRGT